MSSARVWWRGARPRTLVAGIAPVVVGGAALAQLWLFWVAPALGALAAGFASRLLFESPRHEPPITGRVTA